MGFQFSCFCKTAQWFRRALDLFPTARFVGKMEDDSVLHDARVVAELIDAYRLARRERQPSLWYAHFSWAVFRSDGRARFCGDLDDHLVSSQPHQCKHQASPPAILTPFASGGLDIRSRALTHQLLTCAELWDFVRGFDPSNDSYAASCDGQHGYFVARCLTQLAAPNRTAGACHSLRGERCHPLRGATWSRPAASIWRSGSPSHAAVAQADAPPTATVLHLPWPKFHVPSRRHGARLHSSLMHPHRTCVEPYSRGAGRSRSSGGCELPLQKSWRWNLGFALLPLRYRMHAELHEPSGAPRLWLEPHNHSVARKYGQLHVKKEDNRYCEELPCGTASVGTTAEAAAKLSALPARSDMRPRQNMSTCRSMVECFAGDGGRYFLLPARLAPVQQPDQ